MSSARAQILSRIRAAAGNTNKSREDDYARVRREYVVESSATSKEVVELFVDRLQDYGCEVHCCDEEEIASCICDVLGNRNMRSIVAPDSFPSEWIPSDVIVLRDNDLSYEEIDSISGVITSCALAIAETGTVVLHHDRGEGRRALTLIPDYHLCVVFDRQIVATVPEAVRIMANFPLQPMTTISGPSATSDIEMTRVKGVHGPRTLDIILVSES